MESGRHVKAVGQGDPITLGTPRIVERFLGELVTRLGMRIMGVPHVYKEEEGGVSAVAVLTTSHIAIHTSMKKVKDIEYGFFHLDVFSCRTYSDEVVRELLIEHFSASIVSIKDLSGSLVFP